MIRRDVHFIDRMLTIDLTSDETRLVAPDGMVLNGAYDHRNSLITLRATLPYATLVATLGHELAHAADAIGKLELNHAKIAVLGITLAPLARLMLGGSETPYEIDFSEIDFGQERL